MRLIASLIACALMVPVFAQDPNPEDWVVARHEWKGEIIEGRKVEIVNLHGDIRVRGGSAGELFLLANYQHHKDDPRRPEFAIEEREGTTVLEVRYPKTEGAPEGDEVPEPWRKRRVDITVFVPEATDTGLETTSGLAEVRGVKGPVAVTTVKGAIKVRISGPLTAKTQHGEVLAQFRRTDWKRPSRIETVTSSMRIEFPRDTEANVRLQTRGEITTDYSLVIRKPEDSQQLKEGVAEIGEGGGELVLESYRGAIQLIESLVPKETG